MAAISIAGFASTDKVPGAYGEIKYGQGGASAASIPLLLLLVGLSGSTHTGLATLDTEVIDVYDTSIADTAFVPGSEIACMCYDALEIPGVAVKALAVSNPTGSPTAATATYTFTGTASTVGDVELYIGGKVYAVSVAVGETAAIVAAALRDAINADAHCPLAATAASGVLTLTAKSTGARGNQHIVRQNRKKLPGGITTALAGGSAIDTDRVPLSGGAGTEAYTNALAAIRPTQFDRIAFAANDATSLAAIETQLDAQAGVLEGLLQQAVVATNGTQSAAHTLSNTTLNNPVIQQLWGLNSETHPSRLAAQFAAIRTDGEQRNPNASYDGTVLPSAAPQQRQDWPKHSNLVAALNNGVTPLSGGPDGKIRVIRSITSKCLNGSTPDYSTLDTAEVSVPQFILKDLKLFWLTVFLPGNPNVADDRSDGKPRPAGVATPSTWNSEVEGKMRDYESGKYGGSQNAPLIIDVDSHKPVTEFDGIAERLMTAVPTKVAPANHQVGISVRQL